MTKVSNASASTSVQTKGMHAATEARHLRVRRIAGLSEGAPAGEEGVQAMAVRP